jgi:hypothetical protein
MLPPKPSPPSSGVRLFLKVSRAGSSQRLASELTNPFGAADDLSVTLSLILTAFHASIMALYRPCRREASASMDFIDELF